MSDQSLVSTARAKSDVSSCTIASQVEFDGTSPLEADVVPSELEFDEVLLEFPLCEMFPRSSPLPQVHPRAIEAMIVTAIAPFNKLLLPKRTPKRVFFIICSLVFRGV